MDNLIKMLPVTAIYIFALCIIALLVLSYIKRNGVFINANCWFCNDWTRVRYGDRNSFHCPHCLQYNGFNQDGGYNKIIEAQFDTSFVKYTKKPVVNNGILSNGLCSYCNYNQELKIRQLANFEPINDENYDIEVEHFRAQLEKSYELCSRCEPVLKNTVRQHNVWMFAERLRNSFKKGSNKLNQLTKQSKTFQILNLIRYILILFIIMILSHAVNSENTFPIYMLKKFIPVKWIFLNYWCDDVLSITWLGLILDIILLKRQYKSTGWKVKELLNWIILVVISSNVINEDYFVYINGIRVLCSLDVLYNLSSQKLRINGQIKKTRRTFNQIERTPEENDDELCYGLDNLHLSNTSYKYILKPKPQWKESPILSVRSVQSPLILPPKLANVGQNSWTPTGIWINNTTGFCDNVNFRRWANQSSGYVSNSDTPITTALRQNKLLNRGNNIPNYSFENNFSNLSLSVNAMDNEYSLYSEKPVKTAFMNLNVLRPFKRIGDL